MKKRTKCLRGINSNIEKNKEYHGWFVKRIEKIKEGGIVFYELEHKVTGARYVHLESDDRNNVFTVTFKTKPEDSSGIAHILEHTVLTGSKKYPVRDPFFSMLKRSLQTFMNAFTSEDWTAYPFSTQNKKDFYNLLSVYLDAAFFPRITELNFKQEGWRYDFDGDKLVHKGVVFNEMKGSMSSPNRIMAEAIKQSVFDKSSYRFNSGGDPEKIIKLRHKNLKDFHKKFYHPSNAWFFSYGDLLLEKTLKQVSESVLSNFKKQEQMSEFELEIRRDKEVRLSMEYPIAKEEKQEKKFQTCINWLVCPIEDSYKAMGAEFLFDILIGSPASPLKKALLESGLGSDMSDDAGYNMEFRDTLFSVGLKDIKKEDISKVKELIYSTLKNIKDGGIDKKLIDAVIHKQEIYKKEILNSPYPYGLKRWLDMIGAWIHGGNPLELIEYDKNIERLKVEIMQGNLFENLIDKYLLKNKHVSQVILKPSQNLQEELIRKENNFLELKRKNLSDNEIKRIKSTAKNLAELQKSKEDLSVLPSVHISDIDKKLEEPAIKEKVTTNFSRYEVNANGLVYFDCLFDIKDIGMKDVKFLPLLCYLLPRMGTQKKNYEELSQFLDLYTGGISFSPVPATSRRNGDDVFALVFRSKSLKENQQKLIKIFQEIILEFDFTNKKLLKRFLFEKIARIEARVVSNGHVYAMTLAESGMGKSQELQEQLSGISQLEFLKELSSDLSEEKLAELSVRLKAIAKNIFSRDKIETVLMGANDALANSEVKKLIKSLPISTLIRQENKRFKVIKIKETREIPAAISFVAAAIKIPEITTAEKASLFVLSKMLARGFLHNEIREKGGAYGGFARFSIHENIFSFGSYRDPHVKSTLEIYSRVRDYVLNLKIDDEMMEESIIMSIAELDKAKTSVEFAQDDFFGAYIGYSLSMKQEFRDCVLAIDVGQIKKVVDKFFPGDWRKMSVAVFGSKKIQL